MPKMIFKYPIEIKDIQCVEMHTEEPPKIIHVGLDPLGTPCIWAEVNSDSSLKPFIVHVVGTGCPVPTNGITRHIGTFKQGRYMWHVYA